MNTFIKQSNKLLKVPITITIAYITSVVASKEMQIALDTLDSASIETKNASCTLCFDDGNSIRSELTSCSPPHFWEMEWTQHHPHHQLPIRVTMIMLDMHKK